MRADLSMAAILLTLFAVGCTTRQPGECYPYVPVIESSGSDGNLTTYMGIGRTF